MTLTSADRLILRKKDDPDETGFVNLVHKASGLVRDVEGRHKIPYSETELIEVKSWSYGQQKDLSGPVCVLPVLEGPSSLVIHKDKESRPNDSPLPTADPRIIIGIAPDYCRVVAKVDAIQLVHDGKRPWLRKGCWKFLDPYAPLEEVLSHGFTKDEITRAFHWLNAQILSFNKEHSH